MKVRNQRRRILVITLPSMGCFRELLQGISMYGNAEGRWNIQICPPAYDFIKVIESNPPAGLILAAVIDSDPLRRVIQMVPNTVAVCRGYIDGEIPLPGAESDDIAVGRLGAQHLLAKGFRHFAFIGQTGAEWSQMRRRGFEQAVTAAGHAAAVYEIEYGTTLNQPVPVNPMLGPLNDWLKSQSKPLGVMACNDNIARTITQFCADMDFRVPEDVAVLGVDNDDLTTAISNPPLSSVIIPWRAMGRAVSVLLDRLISGESVPPVVQLIPPTGVAERRSTDSMAIQDEQIRTAVRFIRENSGSAITVNQVVDETGITRRGLERKFRSILGRSPLEEIRRCKIERAQLLLSQTSLTIKQIAKQCGFGSVTWFVTAFQEITGESPTKYRLKRRST